MLVKMRKADIQTDITKDTGKGMVTKKWSPCIDGFSPEFPQVGQFGREAYWGSEMGIPNVVKRIQTRFGGLNYIKPNMKTDNYKRKHKLNVKQALFGEMFTYYHPEMKF